MKSLFLALTLAGSLSAVPAAAQSIAGEWDAAMNTPGGVRNFKIVFQADSGKLTGTVKRASGDVPLEGTIKGNAVRFSYTIDYNGNPLLLTVNATLDGDVLKGTIDLGGNAEEEFSARRVKTGG